MESKIEVQFREPKAARTELGEKADNLANQVQLMLSKMDSWVASDGTSSKRTVTNKGKRMMGSSLEIQEDQGLLVELSVVEPATKTKEDGAFHKAVDALPPSIQTLVWRYGGVFMMPTQLPSE
ncbi:unnamed protein product [Citrullus colocynthis]|uniref:Uncharacterized protein n=1 Tax=Citrullus colocynthis TaxID=252529 RepID=A0ABP0YL19_9ROSI